jgi:hypothetical protein
VRQLVEPKTWQLGEQDLHVFICEEAEGTSEVFILNLKVLAKNNIPLVPRGSTGAAEYINHTKKETPRRFSLQANYTDGTTAAGRGILVPTFADRGVSRGQRGGTPTAVNLSFIDRSRYFFLQVASHLCSLS